MRTAWRRMWLLTLSGPLLFGCARGAPPPPKPAMPVVEVVVPRAPAVESPRLAKHLEDVVVPHGSAVSFSGILDAETPSAIIVEIGTDQGGDFVTDTSGSAIPQAEDSGWAYRLLIDNVPVPGEYVFRVLAAPSFVAVGKIRFQPSDG